MNPDFQLRFESIEGALDDPFDQASFSRLWISIGEHMLTRCFNRRTGTRDYVKMPLYQLASGLAENWWTVLYEPRRPEDMRPLRVARHSLDAFTEGYVFPSLAIWSAGEEALAIDTSSFRPQGTDSPRELSAREAEIARLFENSAPTDLRSLSKTNFVSENHYRITVSRTEVRDQLFALVTDVVERIGAEGLIENALFDRWSRVVASLNDPAELNYCIAAGRLGFDPYDEKTPDISILAHDLPEDSFDDLCDAAPFEELSAASAWVAHEQQHLDNAPSLDVSAFGIRPLLDPGRPAWQSGYRAAIALRNHLKLSEDPLVATNQLFEGGSYVAESAAPLAVEGLLVRDDGLMRSIVVAKSSAQRRFRQCRGAYLGWGAAPGSYPLVTTAATHRQQASRAFAAEMLCPANYLRHRAGKHGLTSDQIADIAEQLDCAATIVEHQARNHDIALRGLY